MFHLKSHRHRMRYGVAFPDGCCKSAWQLLGRLLTALLQPPLLSDNLQCFVNIFYGNLINPEFSVWPPPQLRLMLFSVSQHSKVLRNTATLWFAREEGEKSNSIM